MSFVARETEITESMSARTWISPVPGRGKDVVQLRPGLVVEAAKLIPATRLIRSGET